MTDREKQKREHHKEMILLIGGLIIVAICIAMVGFLLYQSMVKQIKVPDYAIAFFSSITTLILGYLFGRNKK
jgi:drug/metabolite transporter (DMT)-like permease